MSRGADPSDARSQARRQMGSVDYVKEACRDMRTLRPVEHFLHDLRFGARLLVRGRGFTTVAVLSLALGIGASSSIFSLINAIVLRPLPVTDPHELHIAQVTEPHEVDLLFSSSVVERASDLLAGRAEIAAQSSTESVLIGMHGDASPPEPARLQLVGRFLRSAAPASSDRSPARSRRQSSHRPTPGRGDQRSVLEPPVWPYTSGVGHRADRQRCTHGCRWRCGARVFWRDG